MESPLLLSIGIILGRFIVGSTLILAGILKLKAGPDWFLQRILAYELVEGRAARLLAQALPWAEVLCGTLLLAGFLTQVVTVFSFALLWVFTLVVISAFLRSKSVDCGCFGHNINVEADQANWKVVYRNLSLMAILTLISTTNVAPLSVDSVLNYWGDYTLIASNWLILIWVSLLILTVGLQIRERRRFA